jgi:hypothetical protein
MLGFARGIEEAKNRSFIGFASSLLRFSWRQPFLARV